MMPHRAHGRRHDRLPPDDRAGGILGDDAVDLLVRLPLAMGGSSEDIARPIGWDAT